MSEDNILEELVYDREVVALHAKKIAKKTITRLQKEGRDGINKDLEYSYTITTTKNKNKWLTLIIINMAHNPKWYHRTTCMVESEKGTKDYFYVRGLSNKKPYFIKLSSHVVKRYIERCLEQRLNVSLEYSEDIAPMFFRRGEIITWMKITDPKLMPIALEADDSHVVQNLFYTFYGCYLGFETEHGNYEFKTCLRNEKKMRKIGETDALSMCYYAHVAFNHSYYDEDHVEKLYNDGLQIIEDVYEGKNLKLMP